jgi:hypothetical protein
MRWEPTHIFEFYFSTLCVIKHKKVIFALNIPSKNSHAANTNAKQFTRKNKYINALEIWLLGRDSARLAKGEVEIVLHGARAPAARNKGELKQFARPQESVAAPLAHVCSARLLTTFSSQ